jgi:hypothetical protein
VESEAQPIAVDQTGSDDVDGLEKQIIAIVKVYYYHYALLLSSVLKSRQLFSTSKELKLKNQKPFLNYQYCKFRGKIWFVRGVPICMNAPREAKNQLFDSLRDTT